MESPNNNFDEDEFFSQDSAEANAPSIIPLRPDFLTLSRREQMSALEVLLFASEEPLSPQALYDILVPGSSDDKKLSGKNAKNGSLTNGTLAHHEEFTDATLEVAYMRTEPPEGMTVNEILTLNSDELSSKDLLIEEVPVSFRKNESLINSLIEDLNRELETTGRVFRVVEVAREGSKGFQFATNPEHGELLASLVKSKSKKRLSKAGLETLAIIAYRQPVSKPELEVIRGVSSHEIMNRLLEKNLITIVGRSESVGKPLLYGTTDEFLRLFGLQSIADLPKPRELEELMAERADILEVAQILVPSETAETSTNIEQSDVSGLL